MRPTRFALRGGRFLAAILSICLLSSAAMAQPMPGDGVTVRLIQPALPEELFQTLVVAKSLEELGYTVTLTEPMSYSQVHQALADDKADVLAFHWDPQQDRLFQEAGGSEVMVREGVFVPNAYQGYVIDHKSAIVNGIKGLADFKDPEIAEVFDIDGDGKADLIGCNPDWSCAEIIDHQLQAYGLTDKITHHKGPYPELIAKTVERFESDQPVFYYTWTPFWVSDRIRPGVYASWLPVPFSSMPAGQEPRDTTPLIGPNLGFPVNTQQIVVRRAFAEANPAAATLLAAMQILPEDISAQNSLMQKGEDSEAEIKIHVKDWMDRHLSSVFQWLDAARAVVAE
ncbi:MAG: glycine betaine/L-proline ABC transporter substrate-binding protein ProX [Rhodospirillaceae bacterium]